MSELNPHEGETKKAILLIGHGSKRAEANDTLRKVAATIESSGRYGVVAPAFLELERPDIQEAFDSLVEKGCCNITVMPYFLYSGAHVVRDLPREIDSARTKHPGIDVRVAGSIGFHDKLVGIVMERIAETLTPPVPSGAPAGILGQHPIERESFGIITSEMNPNGFSDRELPVVKRVIHSTADFEFGDILRISPGAVEAGVEAIRRGGKIIVDVRMVEAGISRERLKPFGAGVLCFSGDADVEAQARREGGTKTAAAMTKAAAFLEGGIAAVGNAPTALTELLRLVRQGHVRPALIVGVPVGFVGASEAKEELSSAGIPYITTEGRKGGSTVAVAIVNAIAIEALKDTVGQAGS